MKSAFALRNLKEYITYTMEISNWERYSFNNIEFIYNGHKESLFNYAFCLEEVTKNDVVEVLEFLQEKKWEATWPVDVHMGNLAVILDDLKLLHASTPKKALLNITGFIEPSNMKEVPNLKLVKVETDELITEYDKATSEIFYHNTGIVTEFIRGVAKNHTDKLQFFLAKINDECVGTCAFYIGSESIGFYADGVFPRFRGQGVASQMILKKIEIAQKQGCKYAIAHCMKQSINLYQRLGFRMLGNLKLYVSEPK
ncbi:MAG: GNAT family N-acetyltransferase [Rickettsiaceae bacterium H1]|nr:GNAT family N-acetyltransferase [Rickettsiaceae bacterium H1]